MRWLLLGAVIVAAALIFGRKKGEDGVRVPTDPGEVLDHVASSSSGGRELKALEAAARASPDDVARATAASRKAIELANRENDPRYRARAQAALQPWWDEKRPPDEVLRLRATIREEQRDFDGARADLEQLDDPKAKLELANLARVTGRYEQARAVCATLEDALVATACTAQVDSVTGRARQARAALEQALARPGAGRPAWALAMLGELCERASDDAAAERAYRESMTLQPDDFTTPIVFADLLLALNRPGEVEPLLGSRFSDDAALLRLAIAENQKLGKPGPYAQMLRWRHAAAAERSDTAQLLERARFALEVEHDAGRALELAVRNWALEKRPADARVLLDAALAAGKPEAAREAAAHLVDAKAEEPRLIAAAKQVLAAAPSE